MAQSADKLSMRQLNKILRSNGIDPEKLRGLNSVPTKLVRLTREETKEIRMRLSRGEIVCMRPTTHRAKRRWEFVQPKNVTINAYHGSHAKTRRKGDTVEQPEHHSPRIVRLTEKSADTSDPRARRVGELLTQIQDQLGVEQGEIAAMTKIDQGSISRFMRGTAFPGAKNLERLGRFIEERPALADYKDKFIEAVKLPQ